MNLATVAPPAWTLPTTAAAATRAARWLARAWDDRSGERELAVSALVLARVCSLLEPVSASALDHMSAALVQRTPPSWGAGDLLSGLIAAGAALGRANPLAQSAATYVQLLADLEPEADGSNRTLLTLALHGADRVPASDAASATAAVDIRLLRSGRREDLERVLAAIETDTMFGLVKRSVAKPAATLLEGAAMASLRAYNLPLAMRLLRARLYVGPGNSLGLESGFEFLRLSQGEDGAFGDFDTALARMAARGDRNGELRIKLPVTLQALWTMAEIEDPSFRLLRVAFSGADALLACGGLRNADERADRVVQA